MVQTLRTRGSTSNARNCGPPLCSFPFLPEERLLLVVLLLAVCLAASATCCRYLLPAVVTPSLLFSSLPRTIPMYIHTALIRQSPPRLGKEGGR